MSDLFIHKGIDVYGNDVTVLSGDLMPESVAKAAADYTGAPLGEPRPGSVLTKVAEIDLVPTIKRVKSEDLMMAAKSEPQKPPEFKPVEKRITLMNQAMLFTMCSRLKAKADEGAQEMGLATGIVMEPGLVDTQGQTSTAEDVEKAMIYWACNSGAVDLMHSFEAIMDERVDVVENWICRAEFQLNDYTVKVGTWLATTKWQTTGKYWDAIKSGTFNAYSIGGLGKTVPLDEGAAE